MIKKLITIYILSISAANASNLNPFKDLTCKSEQLYSRCDVSGYCSWILVNCNSQLK